ncbi:MAG: hypothetical protein ACLRIS_19240 [Flavonifractor plautii]
MLNDCYEKTSSPARNRHSGALVEAYAEDGSNLPEKTFTLTFEFIGQEDPVTHSRAFWPLKQRLSICNVIELAQ